MVDLKGKKVTVVGLGNSGINAAALCHELGAEVFATDGADSPRLRDAVKALADKGVTIELGGHSEAFVRGASLMVLSPGIEDSSPAAVWATQYNIPIISEMELGYRFCKGNIIAITGTNGKSTVTTLVGELLKNGGKKTVVCGNIGNSLCGEVQRINEETWVVLEVSSFQLERIEQFKPHIAVILNITDDHLDRYSKFEDYFAEKLKIFKNQDKRDCLILNYDAENLRSLEKMARSNIVFYSTKTSAGGAYVKDDILYVVAGGKARQVCSVPDIPIKGKHNIENVLASALAAVLAGVSAESMRETIIKFKALPHRCEVVAKIAGVEYIDDSKGTTVDSTLRALEGCDRPVILIAGGKDKNSDYSVLRGMVKEKVSHLILIGEARKRIASMLGGLTDTHEAATMEDAVRLAAGLAKKDSIVLLSPMCSSFDMFRDYKHRGDSFKEAVHSIRK